MDEGFFEEVTFKLRAEQVSSVSVWEKSLPGRGNCRRIFLIQMKEQAQGSEKDQDDSCGGSKTYYVILAGSAL